MMTDIDFEEWLSRLQAGDEGAARLFHDRFSRSLLAVVRRRLDPRILRKMDPEDILQSSYEAFFARQSRGEWRIENWQSLWGVMQQITTRKCLYWSTHYKTGRRNLDIEVSIADGLTSARGSWEPSSRELAPEESAIVAETLDRLARHLKPRDRRVVALHLGGLSTAAIARKVRRSERTIERVLRVVYEFVQNSAA